MCTLAVASRRSPSKERLAPALLLKRRGSHPLLEFFFLRMGLDLQSRDLPLQFLPLRGGDPLDDILLLLNFPENLYLRADALRGSTNFSVFILPCGAAGGNAGPCLRLGGSENLVRFPPVQIHEEALAGKTRPCAPEDCARCAGKQKLHKHKTYQRNADTSGQGSETVHCFRCPRCPVYVSIIPAGMR